MGIFAVFYYTLVDSYCFHLGYSPEHVLLWAAKGAAVMPSPFVLIKASTCEK